MVISRTYSVLSIEGPEWANRGGEWEPIKILLEVDVFSNKRNTTKSQNHLRLKHFEFVKTT
jgi:hypothetical protein